MGEVRGSYTERRLGAAGRVRELSTLLRDQRRNVAGRVSRTVAELERSRAEMERALGKPIEDLDMLVIGPGQQLLEMAYFGRTNRVTGIDLDVIPQRFSWAAYAQMLRRNGGIRALKTVGRKLAGVDRAVRRELYRQTGTRHAPHLDLIAMDATAMTFPDASFDCVFSHSCFEHLAEPEAVIDHLARVLRPGGLAHIEVHLYTSDSGCHDVRIFAGRRSSIPPWSHLRPEHAGRVQPNSYLNRIRLDDWRDMFSRRLPATTFSYREDGTPSRRSELAALRDAGELDAFRDEELLTVDLVAEWRKPREPEPTPSGAESRRE